MAALDRRFFFDQTRLTLFGGRLAQSQVEGLTAILDYWCANHASDDDRCLAYILGTAHHETDRRIQPIREYGNTRYFTRRYDPPPTGGLPHVARQLGNTQRGDGARFCGRGFVQLTGRRNYQDWSNRLGVDLVGDPDKAKDLPIAARILVQGSMLGTFTGRRLPTYFTLAGANWVAARRVINGQDRANLIAGLSQRYYAAISYAG